MMTETETTTDERVRLYSVLDSDGFVLRHWRCTLSDAVAFAAFVEHGYGGRLVDSTGRVVVELIGSAPHYVTPSPTPDELLRNLGELCSHVWHAASESSSFYDDPITRSCGCADEIAPLVHRSIIERLSAYLHSVDVDPAEIERQLYARVDHKWAYDSGICHWLGEVIEHRARTI